CGVELKEGQLSIFYNEGMTINSELDTALREVLRKFGYHWWASGCNLITGVRDLAFKQVQEREDDYIEENR
ncbi:unnamed protein product, partial [marine sediment metagenome]